MNEVLLDCGSESQLHAEVEHRAQAAAMMSSGRDEPAPKPYQVASGVAIVPIKGSLVEGSAGFMGLFGYTGYEDITRLVSTAVADKDVHAILLDVGSGGGHVAGVHDAALALAQADKLKPIVTYTGGMMASAAMWLGASGRKIFASETSIVGSVSVMQIHIDRTEQLAKEGMKATIVRSGEDKATNTPYEPLSDKAKAQMQSQAQEMHDVFLGYVAERRGLSVAAAQAKFGTGKTFVGRQAVTAGLVDEVGGFSAAFTYAAGLANKAAKKAQGVSNSGLVRAEVGLVAPSVAHNVPTSPTPESKMDEDLALAALSGVKLDESPADQPAAAAPTEDFQAKIAALTAELDAAKVATAQAASEVAGLKAQVEDLQARATAQEPLFNAALAIARSSVEAMGVHFGTKASEVASMSAQQVLETHASLAEKFKAKFKAGRVAAVSSEPQQPAKPAQVVDPLFAARVPKFSQK